MKIADLSETVVVVEARIELLQGLATVERWRAQQHATGKGEHLPTHSPLFVGEWDNSREDILLAAREAAKVGDIEYDDRGGHPNGPMVRITEQGRQCIAPYLELAKAERKGLT